ncbi:e3 ubiquitin protein ligase rnf14 [Echinococcus multilocularis]|uniref:E3 ubiquitin protein ligase rnf14 n=1 Tax=Echinococcus multilocularis TaxID=6211 RepID=A0A068Y9R4_ECHMU|nr:e3 ubiquitin protein ligase rnf14 [Echinococcus multilocularis]
MRLLDALSPFYFVLISIKEQQQGGEDAEYVERDDTYPKPICQRLLAVFWLSITGSCAVISRSHIHQTFIDITVAACMLRSLSLVCGEAVPINL